MVGVVLVGPTRGKYDEYDEVRRRSRKKNDGTTRPLGRRCRRSRGQSPKPNGISARWRQARPSRANRANDAVTIAYSTRLEAASRHVRAVQRRSCATTCVDASQGPYGDLRALFNRTRLTTPPIAPHDARLVWTYRVL